MALPLFRPFPGLRPTPELAAQVAAPPYDVLNTEEARALAQGKPHSFLHISKPEIDLPEGTDPYAPVVYAKGAENLAKMIAAGVIRRDSKPCYYVYRLKMGDHVQTGIVAAASVAAYDVNRIRKHEFTRPDKEDDRVRQIDAVNAQTGPVLLAHRPVPAVSAVIARVTAGPAAYDFAAHDGIGHALWVIDQDEDIAAITKAFEAQPAVYIADGHHRSAAASRIAKARAGQGGEEAAHNSFLVVSYPIDEMRIFDYNRVVKDLNGMSEAELLEKLAKTFTLEESKNQAKPKARRQIGLYLAGRWFRMTLKTEPQGLDPVQSLDVSLLTDLVLAPLFGIEDLRKDKRIDFVGGKRGLGELEKRVDSGEMAAAFALYPTSMEDLVAVADANRVMPPKSTWFEPKLADGMVSNPLD
ncbi:MAG: DUF1015 domain-containing protein [Rhodospirillales bacterium]|nr:MAG: DUF1015 domain-containing protein [Rhodospirillales bacterium]